MFYYNITYCYTGETELHHAHGLVAGINYKAALGEVMAMYGDDETIEVSLYYMTDTPIIALPNYISPKEIKEEWVV
jgi:hypothetical protein